MSSSSSRRWTQHRIAPRSAATSGLASGQSSPSRSSAYFATLRPAVLLLARTCLIPLASAAPLHSLWTRDANTFEAEPPEGKSPDDPDLYLYLGIAVALVLLGGAFAGLTIALMGQDETYLQVIATSGEGSERKHAGRVLRLLKRGKHWVLVTLLLSNVITNETLPIVLDRSLGGGWPAVLSSTVLIVIFGEIVPQSICVRYGLSIGAFCAPFVLLLMWIMCPVAWPTAKLLDYLLGEGHGTMYKKAGLKTLVQLHKTLGPAPGERLMDDEVTIINSVLDLKEKPVGDIMTPMQDVFTMSADTVLDERMMDVILSQGYSRIPIYMPGNSKDFIGMLLVKILITYDPEDAKRVRDFSLATLPETQPYTSCLDIINFFQEGKSHMVLVSDFPGQDKGALGVVTLEDVIEELIGEEIIDESDVFIDVHKAIRRLAPAPKQRFPRITSGEGIPYIESDQEAKDATEEQPLLHNNDDNRRASFPNGLRPATFMLRRTSSNTDDEAQQTITAKGHGVPIRSDDPHLREHLKHLGPSNAASKPRATKFTSVKIKPGISTIPEAMSPLPLTSDPRWTWDGSSIPPQAASPPDRPLRSAGRDASDGTSALHASYGTLDADLQMRHRLGNEHMSAMEASQVAEEHTHTTPPDASVATGATGSALSSAPLSPNAAARPTTARDDNRRNNFFRLPERLVVGSDPSESAEAEDVLGYFNDSSTTSLERSRSRRTARPGSITETMVDVGGINKLVLETTSSSEDLREESVVLESSRGSLFGGRSTGGAGNGSTAGNSADEALGGSTAGEEGSDATASKRKKGKRGGKKKSGK